MKRVASLSPLLAAWLVQPNASASDIPAVGIEAAEEGIEAKEPAEVEEATDETAIGRWEDFDYATVVRAGKIRESDLVGKYKQPLWTTKRRFPTTRVYVIPPGTVGFEHWLIMSGDLEEGKEPKFKQLFEVEFGLGRRFQFDAYLITEQVGYDDPITWKKTSFELRYALADWGRIPGNPTLYFEWIRQNEGPQALEWKLLLGGQMTPRWFYGINLVFEREFGGDNAHEYALSFGVSSVLLERRLLLGLEGEIELVDVSDHRLRFSKEGCGVEAIAGPSLQIKPGSRFHINLVPLFGVKAQQREITPIYKIFSIVGATL